MKIQCPKCKKAVLRKSILVVVVVLGSIIALHYMGELVVVDHIWNRDFGRMQKTPEAIQSYHRIMTSFLVKGSLGGIVVWLSLWALLKSGGSK